MKDQPRMMLVTRNISDTFTTIERFLNPLLLKRHKSINNARHLTITFKNHLQFSNKLISMHSHQGFRRFDNTVFHDFRARPSSHGLKYCFPTKRPFFYVEFSSPIKLATKIDKQNSGRTFTHLAALQNQPW